MDGISIDPSIPRVVWFLWFQSLEDAPAIVRSCYKSWISLNPAWRVIALDEASAADFASVDLSSRDIAMLSPQHKADLVRLNLLARHGGVWADATCFCVRPLDEWLPAQMQSGFFAFHRPGPDRIISNWFLAARPGNVLVSRLSEMMHAYWTGPRPRNATRQFLVTRLTRLLGRSRRTRRLWFTRVVRSWLAVCPYFAMHYAFEKLVHDDPACGHVWSRTPKVSADGPHLLHRVGFFSTATDALRARIGQREIPVLKLSWKLEREDIPAGSALGCLMELVR